ncbi:MAG: 1-deoxy-D-xylulose-5-phosphate synthase [Pseudomonadota bacterium]
MFDTFPKQLPHTPLLDSVPTPDKLRELTPEQLTQLANELREFLLYSVSQTGGHFGAGLGVIELTVALHYVFNTPRDKIVWDVGHQCYPHKILTQRKDAMKNLRLRDGIAGFPKRSESNYDTFGVGHSSTSISAALGMAIAAQAQHSDQKTVAVIGDGSMTAGIAFEALNHAAHTRANMLVVLNDNQMSISNNEGGLATYFAKIWASKTYTRLREGGKKVLEAIPPAWELARRTEEHMKGMVSPGTLFEDMGFNYIGLIDGHDIDDLVYTLSNLRDLEGPQLLHITTRKGKGFSPAEKDPIGFHAITKIEPKSNNVSPSCSQKSNAKKYQDVFGEWLCHTAAQDKRLIGITPAMKSGSGMNKFANHYPARFHDVAIAEQHAVTFAAGLACENTKPVVAIYSTFLQRAYDQLIHDVALQNLDVLFAIDRAGLVGEDGPTHHGCFDLSFLRCVPNMLIMAPSDELETMRMLTTGYQHVGPAAVRYPRGIGVGANTGAANAHEPITIGESILRRESQKKNIALLCFGTTLHEAFIAAERMDATVVDMRFVKPLDEQALHTLANNHKLLVTVEENAIVGGAGSAVNEYLHREGIPVSLLNIGIPDTFIQHGTQQQLRAQCGLDADSIERAIHARLTKI